MNTFVARTLAADGLPTDPLDRVVIEKAIVRSGVVVTSPGGVAFVLDGDDVRAAADAGVAVHVREL